MRIRVANHEIEAVIVASSESRLQTVVRRPVEIRQVVDKSKIGELPGEWLRGLAVCDVRLIEINDTGKFHAVVAHVGDIEAKFAGESMLNAQRPILNIRSTEIAIHGEGVARPGVRGSATERRVPIAALDQPGDAGGIDGGGLIRPIE